MGIGCRKGQRRAAAQKTEPPGLLHPKPGAPCRIDRDRVIKLLRRCFAPSPPMAGMAAILPSSGRARRNRPASLSATSADGGLPRTAAPIKLAEARFRSGSTSVSPWSSPRTATTATIQVDGVRGKAACCQIGPRRLGTVKVARRDRPQPAAEEQAGWASGPARFSSRTRSRKGAPGRTASTGRPDRSSTPTTAESADCSGSA